MVESLGSSLQETPSPLSHCFYLMQSLSKTTDEADSNEPFKKNLIGLSGDRIVTKLNTGLFMLAHKKVM